MYFENDLRKFEKLKDLVDSIEHRKDFVKMKPIAKFIYTIQPIEHIVDPIVERLKETEATVDKLDKTCDERIWQAFAAHGYSKKQVIGLANVGRVSVEHIDLMCDVSVDVYSIDDVELFKVYIEYDATETCCSYSYTLSQHIVHTF